MPASDTGVGTPLAEVFEEGTGVAMLDLLIPPSSDDGPLVPIEEA